MVASLWLSACTTSPRSGEGEEVIEDLEVLREDSIEFRFPLAQYRRVSRGYKGRHKGIDVSAEKGTNIYASESGWITYSGRRFRGYGKLVIIEHSKNWATFYAHMNGFAVKEGTWVNKGDLIGYVGSTGRSTGYHLHYEIRYKNKPIDPMPYFDQGSLKFKFARTSK